MTLKPRQALKNPSDFKSDSRQGPSATIPCEDFIWSDKQVQQAIPLLVEWFHKQKRPLPWRKDRDPYKIWVSEIMLQQTTSQAVIPYFKCFMSRFPNVKSLAEASLEEVYEQWTGLGYYSRARNLHKTAQIIHHNGFGTSYEELLKLPGIGPYASRAISSQAFGEKVGVVDGNVNRVYCRLFNRKDQWWKSHFQKQVQSWSDRLTQNSDPQTKTKAKASQSKMSKPKTSGSKVSVPRPSASEPSDINQALMELGATVCQPKNPSCLLCPWTQFCQAFKAQSQNELPVKKPKTKKQIWLWQADLIVDPQQNILLMKESKNKKTKTPLFLLDKWILPGKATLLKTKPKDYDCKHNITHFEIYVKVNIKAQNSKTSNSALPSASESSNMEFQKVALNQVKKTSPFSLVHKALERLS